jgi:glycosyltransferase involved in cell wall biosynthesis
MIQTVEIAICTWNRSASLSRTLDSLLHLRIPPGLNWRILVVDNGSTDDTADVLDAYAEPLPLVPLTEPRQGHTLARNRAIAESRAELILWTDDDVLVDSNWLEAYLAAANQWPQMGFFGGRIEPHFPAGRPRWIEENWSQVAGCFATRDLGSTALELTTDRLPYGANFAVRGDVQRAFPFNPNLGRRGQAVVGEDELDLLRRLLAAGQRGLWVPASSVQHVIPPERASTRYVFDYFVGQGAMLVNKGQPWSHSRWALRRQYLWHQFASEVGQWVLPSPVWFAHLARAGLALGQWQELVEQQRQSSAAGSDRV